MRAPTVAVGAFAYSAQPTGKCIDMPELPEVETVRRGLAPVMEGATITRVVANRPDLRFPLPENFVKRLEGVTVLNVNRRGKYLTVALSSDETLIMHLGMSGRFTIYEEGKMTPGAFVHGQPGNPAHDHIVLTCEGEAPSTIVYNDPRRFGFMDLAPSDGLEDCRHFCRMGPEPLGNEFSESWLRDQCSGKSTAIKTALLDQRVVAGVGNIYACEALFRAKISPRRRASSVTGVRSDRLRAAVVNVLNDAIEAGGSTLRDFAAADGALGYFQHRFDVYDREGEPCRVCGTEIQRIVQGGRSTFFCPACQR